MIQRLRLVGFRNYARLEWRPAGRLAVITGPNGSGKTNLLEAVSLLGPGRGLRGARLPALVHQAPGVDPGAPAGTWAVAARLATPAGEVELGTGTEPGTPHKRAFRLNGEPVRGQAELVGVFASIWLTPQMERLFGEAASGRRRFLDRLVWTLDPFHARELAAHDTAMAGRNRLLAAGGADPGWLAALEDAMARHAVAAAAARLLAVDRLNGTPPPGGFPACRVELSDPVADALGGRPAVAVEDWLRETLAHDRTEDARSGGARLGAHRADMRLLDAAGGLSADQASTGQQKAMLLGLVLAHAGLSAAGAAAPPVLLLDEPLVHLDGARRDALLAALAAWRGQALVTGTDAGPLRDLGAAATFHRTRADTVEPDR